MMSYIGAALSGNNKAKKDIYSKSMIYKPGIKKCEIVPGSSKAVIP
jgi:hypothetical protein